MLVIKEIPVSVIDTNSNIMIAGHKLNQLIFKNSKIDEIFQADAVFEILEKKIFRPQEGEDKKKLSINNILTENFEDHDGKAVYIINELAV